MLLVKISMIRLKNHCLWHDGVYIRLYAIRKIDPNARYQMSNDTNESKQVECSNKIFELSEAKYQPIFQAYKIKYETWDMRPETLIRLTSDNLSYEEFWVSLWDKYYEELSK